MHKIAQEEIERLVPQICARMINEAVNGMIGAMQYDIQTTMTIAFDSLDGMFKSSAARQFVSNKVIELVRAQLEGVKLDVKI